MAATIGELVIELKASTAQFSSDLQTARNETVNAVSGIQGSIDSLTDGFRKVGEAVAFDKIAEFAANSVEHAHQIGNLSIAIGESVEQTSRLAYAAAQADIPIDQLSKTMGALSRSLLEAQSGNKKAGTLFSFLGVDDIKNVTSASDLLLKLVDGFSKLPPSINRAEVATALFNKTGINMLPFLTQSTGQLKALMAQADATGAVVTTSQAEMAEKLQNAYTKMTAVTQAFTVELISKLSPALLQTSDNFQIWTQRIGGAQSAADKTSSFIKGLAKDLLQLNPLLAIPAQIIQRIAPPTPAASAGDAGDLLPETPDKFKAGTAAAAEWKAVLDSLNQTHEKLANAMAEVNARLDAQIAGMKSTTAATDLARLATLGATQAQLDAIDKQERWASIVQSSRSLTVQTAQDFEKLKETWRTMNADKLQGQMLDLGNAMRQLGADAPLAQSFWDNLVGSDVQQQLADANKRASELANSIQAQLDRLRAVPGSWEAVTRGIQGADAASQQHVYDLIQQVQKTELLQGAWNEFSRATAESFDELLFQSKSFGDAMSDLAKKIGEAALQWSLFGTGGKGGLFGGLGSLIGIPGLSSLFRASGGPVTGGSPYIVGEQGPELFVPGANGAILPNGASIPGGTVGGGNTSVVNYYVDARGAQQGFAQQIMAALKASEDRAVARSVREVRDLSLRTA